MTAFLQDSYLHKGLRKKLVEELRSKGINDEKVLHAINNVPRHFFLDSAFDKIAYEDRAFPIAAGQTISQPYTVAYQTELLEVKPKDKVLEIGTGSIYQSTILAEMGARVFTVERQKDLYEKTKQFVLKDKYPFNIKFFFGDGYIGLPMYAPFDKIIVTAAAPYVPEALLKQLAPNGKLVIPVDSEENVQTMYRFTKNVDGEITKESFANFSFVPMLQGKNM